MSQSDPPKDQSSDCTCPVCGRSDFEKPGDMKMHHVRAHSEREDDSMVTCPTCGRDDFDSGWAMKTHHGVAHGERLYDPGPECPTCGKDDFKTESGMKSHHKRVHGESLSKITKSCSNCGNYVKKHPAHISGRVFCNRDCEYEFHGYEHRDEVYETRDCSWCGDEITRAKNEFLQRAFCNRSCYDSWQSEHRRGENHHQWDHVTVECSHCGEQRERPRCRTQTRERHFCNTECHGEWISENLCGRASPHWAGGKSFVDAIRKSLSEARWRDVSAEFSSLDDGCAICDDVANDGRHPVHHIVPVVSGGVNDEWNLMTLCRSCHPIVERFTKVVLPTPIADIAQDSVHGHSGKTLVEWIDDGTADE